MSTEIERKFLVSEERWNKIEKPKGIYYRQGYISTEPQKTIRVRLTESEAYLNIKGITNGATRLEYEYEIPIKDAKELLDFFCQSVISKIRYDIYYINKKWEVDEFLDDNFGLITAEIELNAETENFNIPEWIDKEVTEDAKYYNSNLSVNPFRNW